jgi:NhaP-type Na+/H+ or K+/H+ antiporter
MGLSRDQARLTLATIRLVNGTLALLAPRALIRRLGSDPDVNHVAIYPLRMFGIRTIVLGVQLLIDDPSPEADRFGVLIHATDAATAITAGLRKQLPARVAAVTTGISLTNTALALIIAWPENTDFA